MGAIRSNDQCFPDIPPLYVSTDPGNIATLGMVDGRMYARGDVTLVCSSAAEQKEIEDGMHREYDFELQSGDVIIRTDLVKTFKYTYVNGILEAQELLAEGKYKVYSQPTDPALDNNVKPEEMWLDTSVLTMYIRYVGPDGSESWIPLVEKFNNTGVSNVYFEDYDPVTYAENNVKPKDLWFETNTGIIYIRYPDPDGEEHWVSLIADTTTPPDNTWTVQTEAGREALKYPTVKQGDVCVVLDTNKTYKHAGIFEGTDGVIDWVLLNGNTGVKMYAMDSAPPITEEVEHYSIWYNTLENALYIYTYISEHNKWDWEKLV